MPLPSREASLKPLSLWEMVAMQSTQNHPRLNRSDFRQTMASKRPSLASESIRWNSERFFDQPRPTSW